MISRPKKEKEIDRYIKSISKPTGVDFCDLEQEPCEDAVSRQAVMECFKKWQPYMATRLWDFEKELFSLPSVTPAEKVGHWEWNQFDDGEVVRCSECKEYYTHERKYCPNCGAKMEVEE